MDFKIVNKVLALAIFIISAVVYMLTVQPTFSLWDCGEFIAAAYTLGIPHPPGAPFFILVGKIFTMLPLASDIGLRMNYLSVFSSAGSIALLYLISTKVISNWRGSVDNITDILVVCGSSMIGAFAFAFSDTFWFNALESEVYGFGTFLIALCVYLLMLWWERSDEEGSDKYLLLVAYIVGLAIGIHLLVVQIIFIAGLIFYFRRYEFSVKTFVIAVVLSAIAFFLVYPVLVIRLPQILDMGLVFGILIIGGVIAGIIYSIQKRSKVLNLAFVSIFLIILGYSTYTQVLIRADVPDLPLNENAPKDFSTLVSYLSREQYGDQPLLLPRRYSNEPHHQRTWMSYSSDFDFMWKYQINEMFNRYLFWQFIGRAGYEQGNGVDPGKLFFIPFLLGMLGIFYHFRKDWKLALVFLVMFLLMGIITALYQNQQDPQPRERDYFYVGAFMVFAMWIGFGVAALVERISGFIKNKRSIVPVTTVILIVCLIIAPLNMLRANFFYLDRSGNYVPFDYAYNILQSLEKDAILFTNGDNDTFPLWALQAVYGIRQDVRVVNLSLAQIPWYNLQLKNERPYGASTVPMTYTDQQLETLRPVQWPETKQMNLTVPPEAYPDTFTVRPGEITFEMPATIRQQSGNQVITAVNSPDLLIFDILKANNWERPVYFCITVTNDNFIGLDDYVVLEGMSYRIVPFKVSTPMNIAVNDEVTEECLFNTPDRFYTEPNYGFSFRGLNDPGIFFTEDQRRMIQTYRTLFIRLAYSFAEDSTGYSNAKLTLDEMNKRISDNVVKMDYRIKYDVAKLYFKIGDMAMFNNYAQSIERDALDAIQKSPGAVQGFYSPYKILVDIYETSGRDNDVIDILNRLLLINPNDAGAKSKLKELKEK